MFFNLADGIHPDFGDHTITDEILITPLFTGAFCRQLVKAAEFYSDRFERYAPDGYYDERLNFHRMSRLLFEDYAQFYQNRLMPLMAKHWDLCSMIGIATPYIIRYRMDGKRVCERHSDSGQITLNLKLNDDYVGCNVTFPRQKFTMDTVPVGHACIFPSMLTHPHEGDSPLQSGTKYAMTSFSWSPEWSDSQGIRFVKPVTN